MSRRYAQHDTGVGVLEVQRVKENQTVVQGPIMSACILGDIEMRRYVGCKEAMRSWSWSLSAKALFRIGIDRDMREALASSIKRARLTLGRPACQQLKAGGSVATGAPSTGFQSTS